MVSDKPSEWTELALGDAIELKRGYDLPKRLRRPGGVPIISSSGESGWHDTAKVEAPGVVTGRYGTIGKVFFVDRDFWPLNTALYVRDFKGSDPRFVSYFLRTIRWEQYTDKAAVPGVNRNHVHMERVTWPPLSEQSRIATVLGALDDKIELNQKLNRTLEEMMQAVFKSWFIDFEEPGSFPEGEQRPDQKVGRGSRLGDHVTLQRGTTYKSKLKNLPGPYLLGLATIQRNGGFRRDKLVTYGGPSPPGLLVKSGDLYVSLKDVTQAGDLLGAVARLPPDVGVGRLTQDTVRLDPTEDSLPPSFIYRLLLTQAFRQYCRARATGTTNLGLSRDDFLAYPIPSTSPELAERFSELEGAVAKRQCSCEAESETLAQLRDTLLPKLISGEIRVPEAAEEVEAAV